MTEVAKTQAPADTVTLTIDGIEVTAPKGALLIRVAEQLGIEIPRFCDHPLLEPAGACRQCLVDVEGQRKPVASCTQTVADGMVVQTQLISDVARKAQEGIMELLLANHPLDCPMCDKGGECPLQNQAMSTGRTQSRFLEEKREYPKPINISAQVLLDRERCVLCQRCTRFADQVAGDKFIDLLDRSSSEQIGIDASEPFDSYFSGNTVQICPVGALTSAQYRFRARPFDLVSTPSVCEHCAAGCAQRTDHRRGMVVRRLAGDDKAVNAEWNCDRGRWGFRYATQPDRITTPMVRDSETGELREASWSEALRTAAEGLTRARDSSTGVAVLTGGRLTVEDAYAYSKFARTVLRTNDIDFRARPLATRDTVSAALGEEAEFLAACIASSTDVTYSDVDTAPAVVLVGLEPEDECPILFLRLRAAWRRNGLAVHALAPYESRGLAKLGATVTATVPGDEAQLLATSEAVRATLAQPGAILFVGERLATVEGGYSAAATLARSTGAKLAWVPRRAGDRGAVDAGCLPNLLPGGRLVIDATARAEIAEAWRLKPGAIAETAGRDTDAIIAAAAAGTLGALIVAGVDTDDLADPDLADEAMRAVDFLVSLEVRHSRVTRHANVVLPVAPVAEKAGSFLTWEGRLRVFDAALETGAMTDARVLDALAQTMDVRLGCADVPAVRRELAGLPVSGAPKAAPPKVTAGRAATPTVGRVVLATWRQLIDEATLLEGDETLAATARPARALISIRTATAAGIADGDRVRVQTDRGDITVAAQVTEMPDGVVWLPTHSPGSTVGRSLAATSGAVVAIESLTGGAR